MKKAKWLPILLCIILLTGCQCKHEWIEADCATPKTCSKCGETEGEALGHALGRVEETTDFTLGCKVYTIHCKNCNEIVTTESNALDSFIQDDLFLFTPNQFLERLTYVAKKAFPDFHYDISQPFDGSDTVQVELFFNKTSSAHYYLWFEFFDSSHARISSMDSTGLWYLNLTIVTHANGNIGDLINGDLLQVFCNSCDPSGSDSDAEYLQTMLLLGLTDSEESNDVYHLSSDHIITYEFTYQLLDDHIVLQLLAHPFNSAGLSSDTLPDTLSGTYGEQMPRSGAVKSYPYSQFDVLPKSEYSGFTYPYVLDSTLRQCRGFTLDYEIIEVVQGSIKDNFRFEVLVRNLEGEWKSAGIFKMDGYSLSLDVKLPQPMSVDAVAVTCSEEAAYSFEISLRNPY